VDLVGVAEVADMLGLSRQRVHQLAAQQDFPPPVASLSAGLIWRRDDIRRWAKRVGRIIVDEQD
jgi:predicted DNA-binding transcriptional regulator AlpA